MSFFRWLLRKRYIHTLVIVSWHNYVCILNRSCIVVIQLYLSLIMSNKLFWSWSWSWSEYVVTTRCTDSAAGTVLLRIYQVQLTMLCIVFQRIHNYKWQTFTIGNLILQKWHKITKIVGGIETKSAIPFQFRSIPSCNSNSNSTACNSNSNFGIGIAINSNSNSGIDPNPVQNLCLPAWVSHGFRHRKAINISGKKL